MLVAAFALATATPSAARPPEAPAAVELTLGQLRSLIGQPEDAAAGIAAPGYALACAPPAAAGQVEISCRFTRTLGGAAIHPSYELAGEVLLRELRLKIEQGHIAGLSLRASVDDYDTVQRLLAKAYGPPKLTRSVIRTELGPRDQVQLVWRAAGQVARLVDPAPPDLGLRVDLGG
jgi:hypothetical protein